MADSKKVDSVPVGSSSTNYGAVGGSKAKFNGSAPQNALRNMGGGAGGNKNKMSSGVYKA